MGKKDALAHSRRYLDFHAGKRQGTLFRFRPLSDMSSSIDIAAQAAQRWRWGTRMCAECIQTAKKALSLALRAKFPVWDAAGCLPIRERSHMTSTTSISTSSLLFPFFFSSPYSVFRCSVSFHGIQAIANLYRVLQSTDRPVDAPIRYLPH